MLNFFAKQIYGPRRPGLAALRPLAAEPQRELEDEDG